MNRENRYTKMHCIALLTLCLLFTLVQGLQEKEDRVNSTMTPLASGESSASSQEMHSSSESYSSEEMHTNDTVTTPISINSTRINRNTRPDVEMFSSSPSSSTSSSSSSQESTSSESYSSSEMITVTMTPMNNTADTTNATTSAVTTATGTTAPSTVAATVTTVSSSTPANVQISAPLKLTSDCENNHLKSDKCLQDALFVGQTSAVIPKTEGEMDSYCIVKKQDFNCIKEFGTKCLKNVPRQIYLTITKNVRKMFKEFCDTSMGKQTFLKHLECAKPEHLKILNEVLGRLTLSLEYVANNVSRDEMIFHACCTLQDTYNKIPTSMGNMCSPAETPLATIDFFRSLIRRTVGDIVDIGCGKYSSLQYCEENLPVGMNAMRNYANDADRPLPAMSFMTPLMLFAQKLDGQQ